MSKDSQPLAAAPTARPEQVRLAEGVLLVSWCVSSVGPQGWSTNNLKGRLRAQRPPQLCPVGEPGGLRVLDIRPNNVPSHLQAQTLPLGPESVPVCGQRSSVKTWAATSLSKSTLASVALAFWAGAIPLSSWGQCGVTLGEPSAEAQSADARR